MLLFYLNCDLTIIPLLLDHCWVYSCKGTLVITKSTHLGAIISHAVIYSCQFPDDLSHELRKITSLDQNLHKPYTPPLFFSTTWSKKVRLYKAINNGINIANCEVSRRTASRCSNQHNGAFRALFSDWCHEMQEGVSFLYNISNICVNFLRQ